ncbi:MAG: hypothetical protein JJE05_00315 [Actinobacteria bacterium]|nr:hypothetical protein [Actinomycetota bacterium]
MRLLRYLVLSSLVVVSASACGGNPDAPEKKSRTASSRPLTTFAVTEDDRVESFTRKRWSVSSGGSFATSTGIVAFARSSTALHCVEQVLLRLHVESGEPREDVTLSVYPSSIFRLKALRPGHVFKGYQEVLDDAIKADASVASEPAWVEFDVTEIYRLWVKGGPFPSGGPRVPSSAPVIFTIKGSEDQPSTRTFSSHTSNTSPELLIESPKGCA